jgi:hypothetical protein
MNVVKRFSIMISMTLGLVLGYFLFSEDQETIDQYNYYEENYQTKMGSTMMLTDKTDWTSYELRTFDGGKNWYAVQSDVSDGSVRVLGDADSIYPGLVRHIDGMEKLQEYVDKNGSLDLSGADSLEQIELLESIGITVVLDEKQDSTREDLSSGQ